MLNDYGFNRVEVELLGGRCATGVDRDRSDATRAFLLGAAEKLDAHHIKVGGEYLSNTTVMDHIANEFGDSARRRKQRALALPLNSCASPMFPILRRAQNTTTQPITPSVA